MMLISIFVRPEGMVCLAPCVSTLSVVVLGRLLRQCYAVTSLQAIPPPIWRPPSTLNRDQSNGRLQRRKFRKGVYRTTIVLDPCLCAVCPLMAYELARWRLTTCRYEQLTPPVARLAPPRSSSLGIWAPGMRAAGAARRASGLCRALRHSPRAGASTATDGLASQPAVRVRRSARGT